jgi:hypothetical protein
MYNVACISAFCLMVSFDISTAQSQSDQNSVSESKTIAFLHSRQRKLLPRYHSDQPQTMIIVPAEVIDPEAMVFIGTGDGSAGFWTRPRN